MTEEQSSPKTRSLSKEVEINAPVEAVWQALTDAEELTRWFPLDAKVKPGVGGSIWMSWRNEYEFNSPIEVWEPNRRLRLVASGEADDSENAIKLPTQVAMDFHLESRGNRTVLRLVHSGFSADAEWDEWFEATHRGWDYQFWGLGHYLEYHRGKPRGIVYIRHLTNEFQREDAWKRLMSPEGLLSKGVLDSPESGDRYDVQTRTGERLQGIVRTFSPPKDFTATVENLNNATMRIQTEDFFGKRDVTVTLSTYGLPQSQVESMRQRWTELLTKLF